MGGGRIEQTLSGAGRPWSLAADDAPRAAAERPRRGGLADRRPVPECCVLQAAVGLLLER